MVATPQIHRLLWLTVGGLVLGILGYGWDRVWHRMHAGLDLSGASEVLEAHWLMILGVVIMFGALLTAVRRVRQPGSLVASVWIAFVGAASMVVGFAWDSVRHVQGTESPTAHAMIYVGLLLVIVAIPAALTFARSSRPSSETGRVEGRRPTNG